MGKSPVATAVAPTKAAKAAATRAANKAAKEAAKEAVTPVTQHIIEIDGQEYRTTFDSASVKGLMRVLRNRAALEKAKGGPNPKKLAEMYVKVNGVKMFPHNLMQFAHEVRKKYELAYALSPTEDAAKRIEEEVENNIKKVMVQKISFKELSEKNFSGIIARAGFDDGFLKELGM